MVKGLMPINHKRLLDWHLVVDFKRIEIYHCAQAHGMKRPLVASTFGTLAGRRTGGNRFSMTALR